MKQFKRLTREQKILASASGTNPSGYMFVAESRNAFIIHNPKTKETKEILKNVNSGSNKKGRSSKRRNHEQGGKGERSVLQSDRKF